MAFSAALSAMKPAGEMIVRISDRRMLKISIVKVFVSFFVYFT